MNPLIKHDQYDKITDDVFILGDNVSLRFTVILNKHTQKYGTENYHKELEYYSKKAGHNVVAIRRSFEYFLSVENMRSTETSPMKESIIIGPSEMILFRNFLLGATEWFTSLQFQDLYASKNGHLVMTESVNPIRMPTTKYKYLAIEPIIYVDFMNTEYKGVRLYLSSDTNYVEMPFDKMMGLFYLVDKMDMYQCACALINYLQRPEYGTNLVSFGNTYQDPEQSAPVQPSGRKIGEKKKNIFQVNPNQQG